jgi:hypothetical protein
MSDPLDLRPRQNGAFILALVFCGLAVWRSGLTLDGCEGRNSYHSSQVPSESIVDQPSLAKQAAREPEAPPVPEDPRVSPWNSIGHALWTDQISEPLPEETVAFLLAGLPIGDPDAALAFCSLIDLCQKGPPPLRAQAKRIVSKGMASERAALKRVLTSKGDNAILDRGAAAAERNDCYSAIQELYTFEGDVNDLMGMAAAMGLRPEEDLNAPEIRSRRRRQFLFAMFDERLTLARMQHGRRH